MSQNPSGRPKGSRAITTEFLEALREVEKEKGKSLFRHACEQAFNDNTLLAQVLKKFLPDITRNELVAEDGAPLFPSLPLFIFEGFSKNGSNHAQPDGRTPEQVAADSRAPTSTVPATESPEAVLGASRPDVPILAPP